ncbi:MAG: hypothetical protein ACO3A2_07770 [Bdellovibrionia bacterium]
MIDRTKKLRGQNRFRERGFFLKTLAMGIILLFHSEVSWSMGPKMKQDSSTGGLERFSIEHQGELMKFDAIDPSLPRSEVFLRFLLESKKYQQLAEKKPHELIQSLQIFYNSYRISEDFKKNLELLFDFYLKEKFSKKKRLSFQEISQNNLEILLQMIEKTKPLSEQELHFIEFFKKQELYLKRPTFLEPEKYHQGLVVSYDLFAYPALKRYLQELKKGGDLKKVQSKFSGLWSSPHGSEKQVLIQELEKYVSQIQPLSSDFYRDLPLKNTGYNAAVDAPLLENGQFVFFRLTADSDEFSRSNMGDQFMVFKDDYLEDMAVIYLSDQIDPWIRKGLRVDLEDGVVLTRTTEEPLYQDLMALDPQGKLDELNSTSQFYSVCYGVKTTRKCYLHHTANEVFYAQDIRKAIALRLILELRRIQATGSAHSYVSSILSKTSLDSQLRTLMKGVMHIQALYPAFYPIQSPRFLGVLGPR